MWTVAERRPRQPSQKVRDYGPPVPAIERGAGEAECYLMISCYKCKELEICVNKQCGIVQIVESAK